MSNSNKKLSELVPKNVRTTMSAEDDFNELDYSVQLEVLKAIRKVSANPAPNTEGGYGKPLGGILTGYLKVKLKRRGVRIIYRHIVESSGMRIIVIGMRSDEEVYQIAAQRVKNGDI